MTSQWSALTFDGVTRVVSSYIMMHMHGGFGKPRSFPHQLFGVGPLRGQELRVERQSLWEGVPRWIYQWSAGLLISSSLPLAHKSVFKKRWSTAGAQEGLGKRCLMHEDQCIQDIFKKFFFLMSFLIIIDELLLICSFTVMLSVE